MATIKEVVSSYEEYLDVKRPAHFERFLGLYRREPEAAQAEAIVFQMFRRMGFDVNVAEDISTGGADFLVSAAGRAFMVEATCLDSDSLAADCGLPNRVPTNAEVMSFSHPTHLLRTKLSSKAPQVAGVPFPRLVAIVCFHPWGAALLGKAAAEALLTSDCMIAVSLKDGTTGTVTDLKDSSFFRRRGDGTIETCRKSISAVALVQVSGDCCHVCAVLHPDPAVPFPVAVIPEAPFLRVKVWPPAEMQIETEWITHDPPLWASYHQAMGLREDELKGS
jgi:hypothetical protein